MKVGAQLLLACVVLAAIKAAVAALLLAAALAGAIFLTQRPRESLIVVGMLATTTAFVAQPALMAALIVSIAIGFMVINRSLY